MMTALTNIIILGAVIKDKEGFLNSSLIIKLLLMGIKLVN